LALLLLLLPLFLVVIIMFSLLWLPPFHDR
jgi:hypothetical protein